MDIEHHATAQAATSDPYHCSSCDYEGVGHSVSVADAIVAQGGLVFGSSHAGEMARDEADAAAWAEVLSNVAMAPCPRCGAVDRSAWVSWMKSRGYLPRGALGIAVFVVGLLALGAVFSAGNLLSVVCALLFGLGFSTAGVLLAVLPLRRKRAATRDVRFEPPR